MLVAREQRHVDAIATKLSQGALHARIALEFEALQLLDHVLPKVVERIGGRAQLVPEVAERRNELRPLLLVLLRPPELIEVVRGLMSDLARDAKAVEDLLGGGGLRRQRERVAQTVARVDDRGGVLRLRRPVLIARRHERRDHQHRGDGTDEEEQDPARVHAPAPSASAPATTSRISWVISACRARFISSVSRSIRSPAFFDAFRIAVMRAPCSDAADSSSAR